MSGLLRSYYVGAQLHRAHELGHECFELAEREQDPILFLETHRLLGGTLFYLGELEAARRHLESCVSAYDPQSHHSLALRYGTDPGVVSLCYASNLMWCLGYPEQALRKSEDSLALAQQRAHPLSLAGAWHFAAITHQFRGEARAAQERAESAIALSNEQGFAVFSALGTIDRGWAAMHQGQEPEGIAKMREGMAAYAATGSELWRPFFLSLLATVYAKTKQADDGLAVVAEALAAADKSGERWWLAEIQRLQGELLQRRIGSEFEAEMCFRQAAAIAQGQQSKSLELRATMSLARLLDKEGCRDEARAMLANIYGWFTEGFETADLKDAKALLGELGGSGFVR